MGQVRHPNFRQPYLLSPFSPSRHQWPQSPPRNDPTRDLIGLGASDCPGKCSPSPLFSIPPPHQNGSARSSRRVPEVPQPSPLPTPPAYHPTFLMSDNRHISGTGLARSRGACKHAKTPRPLEDSLFSRTRNTPYIMPWNSRSKTTPYLPCDSEVAPEHEHRT